MVYEIIDDNKSGLEKIIKYIKRGEVDTLIIWDLSDLDEDLREFFTKTDQKLKNLVSYKDRLNSIEDEPVILFSKLIKLIEEKQLINHQARIKAGIVKAKAKGKQLGRPKVPERIIKRAREMQDQGLSNRKIARILNIDESTIRKKIKQQENEKI